MSVLNLNVLVLNKLYVPIRVTTARNAFIMLCNGRAEAVTVDGGYYNGYDFSSWAELSSLKRECEVEDDDDWVSTASIMLAIPRVIRVLDYVRVRDRGILLTRKNIFYRDDNTCQFCGEKKDIKELSLDHVVPKSKGGCGLLA